MTHMAQITHVKIYTYCKKCKYSREIMTLASELGVEDQIQFIDVETNPPPQWLPGTPSVVCGNDVYCGDAGFNFVSSMTRSGVARPVDRRPLSAPSGQSKGLSLSHAFQPLAVPEDDEESEDDEFSQSRHKTSTNDIVARLLAERG